MNNKHLVIIPTYNEKENIRDIIKSVLSLPLPFEILIIDDGSPDGTADIVKELKVENEGRIHMIERDGKQGLGTAYIAGFKYAISYQYDYIYEMDADFSHNPEDLMNLYSNCVHEGNDMAIGSRYIQGVNVVNWPIGRVLMSYFASVYVRLVTGIPVQDTTAGFKCYHRSVLETINPDKIHFIGYAFQIEMKFNAWKHGFKIGEVPIIFTDRTKGQSKMSGGIFREAVFGVLEMKIKSLFKKYEPAYVNQNVSLELGEFVK
ncbi:MAG: dolichol-phosphate mannosyltransferase [Cyclobacteriaceae bacterium]|jgi:dolichol-phosphate mannosyltransferase